MMIQRSSTRLEHDGQAPRRQQTPPAPPSWDFYLAAHSREVVALGKRAFYEQIDRGIADAYAHTSEAMACNLMLPDAAEGIDAFLGKRDPRWKS